MPETPGLHHVTAIAGDPGRNADFYVGVLGLRVLKRTVNHDDPTTYHLYYGDGAGTPGTAVTFFPWTDAGRRGEFGAGQTQRTAWAVPPGSLDYWTERLDAHGVAATRVERVGEPALEFDDPDGIGLAIVGTDALRETTPWTEGPVPDEHQLRGFHGVTLAVPDAEPTADVLRDVLGYEFETEAGERRRYRAAGAGPGSVVDLVETGVGRGRTGVGTVHHVAFAAADLDELEAFRERAVAHGHDHDHDHDLRVTDVVDRAYFRSIYFREPGGVLFEVATTGPGFTADEAVDELGSALRLPAWLEDDRERIEAALPAFDPEHVPGV
jgi:glyoxalase family protein